ncbi:MAG: thiamine pyrophosphate-dependent dehydrogenase E1 component subunit alpha [Gemmatimonadetes bacterium]|nr:thiamine pyrophosphate-dependent dehydrogenase E1 component subunit alpha [Gemmatimonadota bacterium]MYB05341.1 thiamine pyrophosphate-dependent dehydrogenase E1 component subunit alpha [Gemmatimonadota bacterium]MYE15470.1 thiamine pyrophosphate-dependent dehydrogenase E1 component subunit alpha [Gemmatimonadota bacterium]MYG22710.1 thiamine pyrophosphate-dependent dehydrogenase E1 component subunit alpha [Gemmatimonadota bacterium]MYJ38185.1 thiamine pyrophosphate-dependent dehydrogenase E
MERHPAFDPPEYRNWTADPVLVRDYRSRITGDPLRAALVDHLESSDLLGLYRDLVLTRLQDIGLQRWVRQGVISKAWLGVGEEAVTVGCVAALDRSRDVVIPMIRNAGACHMMGLPLEQGFTCYLGTADSPSGGRDFHYGDIGKGVIQPVSHMGTSVPVAAGAALAFRNRGEERVALTWTGDGATKTAAFHEGMVFASRLGAPLILVIQNNQVALGTTLEQHGAARPEDMPAAYGIEPLTCDGNNVLDVYAATALARERCIQGNGPAVVVAETFRMGGHATHDEQEARDTFPAELFVHWGRRDPVGLFEAWLIDEGIPAETIKGVEASADRAVREAADRALSSRDKLPEPDWALFEGFSEGGALHGLAHRLAAPGPPRILTRQ